MSKFRFNPNTNFDWWIKDENTKRSYKEVPRPKEIPEQAERYGEYYVRHSQHVGQNFYCCEGKWYIYINYMGKEEKGYLSYPKWCAYAGCLIRLFTREESIAMGNFLGDGLLNANSKIVDVYMAYLDYKSIYTISSKIYGFRAKKRLECYKKNLESRNSS